VLFDLRGTLVDPASGWRLTDDERVRFLRSCGADAPEVELRSALARAVGLVNRLAPRARTYFDQDRTVLLRAARAVGVVPACDRLDAFEDWRNRAFARQARAFPDAAPTLQALRAAGLPVGCVADGALQWTELVLERAGLLELLDVVVASAESGEVKATGAALLLACERLGVDVRDVLFVGDRADKDVAMARTVGARALLLSRTGGGDLASLLELSSTAVAA